jgi:hypothetical protein
VKLTADARSLFARLIAGCALSLLSGCDSVYGVTRSALIANQPDIACVERVIRATPKVARVSYVLSGTRPINQVHSFIYGAEVPSISGALQFGREYSERIFFRQTYLVINRLPDPATVASTRPVMLHVENELARHCGLNDLPQSVVERCTKVECPPLPAVSPAPPPDNSLERSLER